MARRVIQASGAVVFRGPADALETLVVHRPRYDDWALPKGKVGSDEYPAVAAVREVREETGYAINLVRQLGRTHYLVDERPKVVQWWLGVLIGEAPGEHDQEADRVEWWPVQRAIAELSYPNETQVVANALHLPTTRPLLIVRHTKAMGRKQWHGPDTDRRLTERGRRQAQSLIGLFEAFGVGELASSSSTRCMNTLAPYARLKGLGIISIPALSEEGAAADPGGVFTAMASLRELARKPDRTLAICGHRPVLPSMFESLGTTPQNVLRPGEVVLTFPEEAATERQTVHIPPTL